ncbi:MAG TPA: hypothetical protein ENJ95_01950 [Bacteroidetes bacterium]|nr:hypothetical protein [Bacteroidota bacterium]
MKSNVYLFSVLLLAMCQLTCSPECISIFNLQIRPNTAPVGSQILLTDVNNENTLRGRNVFFGDGIPAENLEFVPDIGLLATVPNLPTGTHDISIEEPDCGDFVRTTFEVISEESFFNNPNFDTPFITPSPLQVVIPTIDAGNIFPPSVTNAWISPDNPDYCIWFKFIMNGTEETSSLRANEFVPNSETTGSFELGVRELLDCDEEATFLSRPPRFWHY